MTDSHSRFAAMPPRQKVTVIIFLIIFIFIIWEVIGMFRGSGGGVAASTPAKPATTVASMAEPKATLPNTQPAPRPEAMPGRPSPQQPPSSPQVAQVATQQSYPEVAAAPPATSVFLPQEQIQNKYVSALNELQMLKIQKEIAETSQAIVAAKLATVSAEKSITEVLSEAEAVSMPSNQAKPIKTQTSPTSATMPLSPPAPIHIMNEATYSVQSVSMELDQWHAVLRYKNKLYDVGVGDVLPPDNSIVKAIDQKGVTLEFGGVEQKIPLTVTDNVALSPSQTSSGGGGSATSTDEIPRS